MTFSEFKDELYKVKDNRRKISSISEDLANLPGEELLTLSAGAVDYSKDHIQSSPDPDKAIIEAIYRTDKKYERLVNLRNQLLEQNDFYESLIFGAEGLGGEMMRLFFIEGMSVKRISDRFAYTRQWTWQLINDSIHRLYEKEEENLCRQ